MRAYACGEIGTDTWITVPLSEPYPVDPDTLLEQTTVEEFDGLRPEFGPEAGFSIPVEGRNPTQPLWLVIDRDATAAPGGTFDLGDPSDPDWQTTALTNPEKNYLTSTFPEGDMDAAETRGDVLTVIRPEFRGAVGGVLIAEWGF